MEKNSRYLPKSCTLGPETALWDPKPPVTQSRTQSAPLRARRAPSLEGGVVSVLKCAIIGKEGAFSCQKGASAGGKGPVSASKDAVMSEKGVFRARKAALPTERARYLLRMAQPCSKGVSFLDRRASSLAGGGTESAYKGALMGEKGDFLCQNGASTCGRALQPLRRSSS